MAVAKPVLVSAVKTAFSGDSGAPGEEPYQLSLFQGHGGDDVAALRKHAMEVHTAARPKNTAAAWESDWKSFRQFCLSIGRTALPASVDTVSLYCAAELKADRKVSTIRRRLWSIRGRHEAGKHANPVTSEVTKLLTAASRVRKEKPDQAEALTAEHLRAMCGELRRRDDAQAARDRLLLIIGFGAALRASEAVALQLSDLLIAAKGITVKIRHSKADQEGKGASVYVFRGRHEATDVLDAYKRWLKHRGKDDGPLFGIGDDAYRSAVKRCVQLIGLDPENYAGHSLRSGAITAALQGGTDPFVVMRELSRHSDMKSFERYVRKGRAWKINPLAGAL